jgi:hypothetical protein
METDNKPEEKEVNVIQTIESIKDTPEFQTLLTNHAQKHWKDNIGSEVKNIYSSVDTVFKDVLGIEKPSDKKSTELLRDYLSEYKELKSKVDILESNKDNVSEEQEKLWNSKFHKLQKTIEEKEAQLIQVTQKGFENNINNKIDSFLVSKTFNPVFSENDLTDLVNTRKMRIIKNTKQLDNGKIAILNPNTNEFYTNALGEPLSIQEVADMEFKSLYQVKKQGGNAPKENIASIQKGDVLAVNMDKVKTREDFYKEFKTIIAPKGLASHETKYLEIQRATMEHYGINKLPLA